MVVGCIVSRFHFFDILDLGSIRVPSSCFRLQQCCPPPPSPGVLRFSFLLHAAVAILFRRTAVPQCAAWVPTCLFFLFFTLRLLCYLPYRNMQPECQHTHTQLIHCTLPETKIKTKSSAKNSKTIPYLEQCKKQRDNTTSSRGGDKSI